LKNPNSPYKYRWERISEEQKADHAGEIRTDNQGHSYIKKEDEFFKYAAGCGAMKLKKWEFLFLDRYLSRFDTKKSSNLTYNQHDIVTSSYKTISKEDINNSIDAHPELGMVHSARDHKRGLSTVNDRRDWLIHNSVGGTSGSKTLKKDGSKGGTKQSYGKDGITLSPNYQEFLDKESPSSSERTKDEDLPLAQHTDIMVGGVVHKFGGEGGDIQELNKAYKDGAKWQPIPQQNIFVPLLHRGQVLPSEKQLAKGINVGSFGHSQSSEVEINHFGNNPDDDEFPVSKHVAEKYDFSIKDSLSLRIEGLKKKGDKSPKEKEDQDNYENMFAERGELYFINRNNYFWEVAARGERPDKEFFSSKDVDHAGIVYRGRNTDHHQDHMTNGNDSELDQEDGRFYYDRDDPSGEPKNKSYENGIYVLKSVHAGVDHALKKIKENSEPLYDKMKERLWQLWDYGEELLKANVSHPQFFYNKAYQDYLRMDEAEIPKDDDGNFDPQKLRKTEQKIDNTSKTGFLYRRMRVENYIRSFSQKELGEGILTRRKRPPAGEGKQGGHTKQIEAADNDINEIANNNRVNQRDQHEIAKKRRGRGDHQGEVGMANSFQRSGRLYTSARKDAQDKFILKNPEEMTELETASKDANLALLAIWAIQTKKVPRAREIAQLKRSGEERTEQQQADKLLQKYPDVLSDFAGWLPIRNPVSKEVALSREFANSEEYKEAHHKQFKLAWVWGKTRINKDWNERLAVEDGFVNITSTIDNKKFIDSYADKDPIKELWDFSAYHDKTASFDLLKYSDEHRDYEDSGLTRTDDDDRQNPLNDKQYAEMVDGIEDAMPHGLFDFESGSELDNTSFKDSMDGYAKAISGEYGLMPVKAIYDHLLKSVSHHNVQSKDEWTEKLKEELEENALLFADYLTKSPVRQMIDRSDGLATNFFAQFEHKVEAVKNSYDRSISRLISSSAGSQTNAGRIEALNNYNMAMDAAKTDDKKSAVEERKKQYEDVWEKFSEAFHKSSFDHNYSGALAGLINRVIAEKPEFEKDYKHAFEDAYIDSLSEFLKHEDNFSSFVSEKYQGIKTMTQFLAKEVKLSKHFKNNVREELKRTDARHSNSLQAHEKKAS
jgi:hypothetical protein